MDEFIKASQKRQDAIAAFWPRRVSPYLTKLLVRTPITPNQTTLAWGALSVLNSYTVYRALTGSRWVIPVIPAVYVLCYVLDCCDGEIARYKKIVNPVGGKLLDGISHRATEYSLLATFGLAAYARTGSPIVLPLSLLLLSGDAMYTYVYERRLTALRHESGFSGHVGRKGSGIYNLEDRWAQLTSRQKIGTVVGQLHYKSIYPVIALSYAPGQVLLGGIALLAAYKHWKWMRLMYSTLAALSPGSVGVAEPVRPAAGDGASAVRVAAQR